MNVGVIRYVIKTPWKTIKNDVEEYVVLSRIYRELRRIYRQTRRQVIVDVEEQEIEDAMLSLIVDYSSRDGALEIDDENGYILQVKEDFMIQIKKFLGL